MKIAKEFLTVPERLPLNGKKNLDAVQDLQNKFETQVELPEEILEFLSAVFTLSPHLKTCALRDPEFVAMLFENGFSKSASKVLDEVSSLGVSAKSEAEIMQLLRRYKRQISLLCGLADLGGWWHGREVTKTLSDFANTSMQAALGFILLQQHHAGKLVLSDLDAPQSQCGLIVLGMGKLGAGELNYSSDIDLILFYEAQSGMKLETDDPITLLSRIAKQFVKIMQERTPDGYVFRMDLRLRPDPSSTPLVIPVEAALIYYEGQGQNWERAAMIKAKAVAGDIEAGESFLQELSPFVWRKYLDFAAINDIHSIKRQIHAHKGHDEIKALGHNVKLGRGGIREIEFFAQTQQLIAGGRNLKLRTNNTITALHELADLGWVKLQIAEEMAQAYWFLRDVEHRLQMVSDEQTHTLPSDKKDFLAIANMCGFETSKAFSRELSNTLKQVNYNYAGLFESSDDLGFDKGNLVFTGNEADPETIDTLSKMGYKNPEEIVKTIKKWHVAKLPALRATKAREMLTEMVPSLLSVFALSAEPDETFLLFDRFVSGLPAGIQLFSILQNNPALADLLLKLLTSAPRLAQQISRKPHIFDSMIDPDFANEEAKRDELVTRLDALLKRAPDYEGALDVGRRFFQEVSFLYGCQFFSGILSLEKVKAAYSILGDVLVDRMYAQISREFEKKHGKIKGAQSCILGMGRLGSRELTVTSDLDLIFLYNFDEAEEMSDGEKPLSVSVYFIRLMQRFIAGMSSPTSEGIIYDLDFRLRPSGNAGPLATHVNSFLKYQREEAWIWETQALTRARPIAGDQELMVYLTQQIPPILETVSKKDDLKKEIFKMRNVIESEKGSKSEWDVKTVQGGLIDIEFMAQYFVINGYAKNSASTYEVISKIGSDHLEEHDRETLIKALKAYELTLHLQRICLGENADTDDAPSGFHDRLCNALELPDLKTSKAYLSDMQKQVRRIFQKVLG